jgi:hypothetical protein
VAARIYAAWIPVSGLRILLKLPAETTVLFAYYQALTSDPKHPATDERVARVSGRDLVLVKRSRKRLVRAGLMTSQWLGFQDFGRRARIEVGALNTLHEMGVEDRLVAAVISVLAFTDKHGFITHGPTQISVVLLQTPNRILRWFTQLEELRLVENHRVAEFIKKRS